MEGCSGAISANSDHLGLGVPLGEPFMLLSFSWWLHYGAGTPARRDPIPGMSGSIPAWVLSFQFIKIELTPEGLIGHPL